MGLLERRELALREGKIELGAGREEAQVEDCRSLVHGADEK